jgi:hypothetical protein
MITQRVSQALLIIGLYAVLAGGCGSTGIAPVDATAACSGNTRPDLCRQAFDAVIAELGGMPQGSRIRIDPVQCANDRCWTWAYVTPNAGGLDQQLSVDWTPNGEISISHVVPG